MFGAFLLTCLICFADSPSTTSMLQCPDCGSYNVDMVMDHQIPANYTCTCKDCHHMWGGRLGIITPKP